MCMWVLKGHIQTALPINNEQRDLNSPVHPLPHSTLLYRAQCRYPRVDDNDQYYIPAVENMCTYNINVHVRMCAHEILCGGCMLCNIYVVLCLLLFEWVWLYMYNVHNSCIHMTHSISQILDEVVNIQ